MRMLAFAFALPLLVVVALILPAAAEAQQIKQVEVVNLPDPAPPAQFQLVGFTSTTGTGNRGGTFGATLECQDDFADSRICTSQEVLDIVAIPVVPSFGKGLVRPVTGGQNRDISGLGVITSCDFWTRADGVGLVVRSDGVLEGPTSCPRIGSLW